MQNLSLVIPCYNEAERLPQAAILAFVTATPEVHLLFVNDGSTDATAETVETMSATAGDRVELLNLPANRGKAEAVRAGVLHLLDRDSSPWIGFWDADLATPLEEAKPMQSVAEAADADMVCGCRLCRLGAHVSRSPVRHYIGRVFATAVSLGLDLPVYDTQCGAKLIRAQQAQPLFADPFAESWLFDVELFARYLRAHGRARAMERIVEYPLDVWIDKPGSRLRLGDMMAAPWLLMRLMLRHRSALRQAQTEA